MSFYIFKKSSEFANFKINFAFRLKSVKNEVVWNGRPSPPLLCGIVYPLRQHHLGRRPHPGLLQARPTADFLQTISPSGPMCTQCQNVPRQGKNGILLLFY